jgi:hypothetical protein
MAAVLLTSFLMVITGGLNPLVKQLPSRQIKQLYSLQSISIFMNSPLVLEHSSILSKT